jgi:translation initiation factor 1
MARKKTADKIDTAASSQAWVHPFAELKLEGLPAGEVEPQVLAPTAESGQEKFPKLKKKGRVVLRRETAQRGGKVVVVAGDFEELVAEAEIQELARKLRKVCGCGGTVRGREVEIQGEHAAKVAALLEEEGFRVVGVRS